MENTPQKRYLVLADGTVFQGFAFGANAADQTGELVFTTGMCGYLETLTDPSYYGQIVLQTFPLIGNYGVIPADFEGTCCLNGYVVREWCPTPSNFRCETDLDTYLKAQGVPGLWGVDTRQITRRIREKGVVNAMLCDTLPGDLTTCVQSLAAYRIVDAVEHVTADTPNIYPAQGTEKHRVTLIDYGAKHNIIRCLCQRGCTVRVVNADTTAKEILADAPDGVMLSNGPGDPAENTKQIEQLRQLAGNVPMFGICLGHQLLALALGGKTVKMKYGHRGINQPVRQVGSHRTYITNQNHGYAVEPTDNMPGHMQFVNANDGTCEGMEYPTLRAFTVQFHPEACSGVRDTMFLFDRFVSMMDGEE